ncbi:3-hydroxyacyl-CoA dehydrogenase NAD-binding domain-containing protein [Pseudovibrio sp. Ad26]|uniref:3-hydroxyacyl-CoA dehydrogenase family protein n=1 Tax=Pseudovibrio sp. Ad26 TaxID=989410 RepID=UPI0007AEBF99|nr:3-hydroxyacyl-CoA dehydrogenase NAD-binding domain-containing protein [Pseudovibrio sp. Ad26]KZL05760.1 L-carnitine dehydrogenase [Pseudovibrio sp. Ad26]
MNHPNIAILGAGTIGMSWAALFAATGRQVTVYDPSPETEDRVTTLVKNATETLAALGWQHAGDTSKLQFTNDPVAAVSDADFIQESVPERLEIKHGLYQQIEPHLKPEVIIGSSTSGLKLSEMQAGFHNPGRFILAHPFNPPHLIPLVELMDNEKTDAGVLQSAKDFYESIGKVCVRLNKEVPGHIANRLQAAIWRETIHLAMEGVASVEDIDKAAAYGPGLRWAAMGPNTLLHLGGGEGGIRSFCDHLGGPFQSWWDDLGSPRITPEVVDTLEDGVKASLENTSMQELAKRRDDLVLQYVLSGQTKKEKSPA